MCLTSENTGSRFGTSGSVETIHPADYLQLRRAGVVSCETAMRMDQPRASARVLLNPRQAAPQSVR